ncbi:MAG: Wzz/FepE/Etk N-terminal domain-containing protein [Desulfobacterales bacterium]
MGQEDEINLLDLLMVLLDHKKLIAYVTGGVFLISLIISFLLPIKYKATTRILPPSDSNTSIPGLLTQSAGPLVGLAGSLMGAGTPADLYVGILQSRSVADNLIERFNLKQSYGVEYREDIYKLLNKYVDISISSTDQIVSVAVEDEDPETAADLANAYVELLDRINRKVNISEGHQKRIFLEDRLKEVSRDLAETETDLKRFQEKYKLISIEEQAKIALEGAAEIKAGIIAAQTELEVLRQFGTERQNEAVMLKSKINELQRQLAKIQSGQKEENAKMEVSKTVATDLELFIPIDELPELGLKMTELMRDLKIQQTLFELLTTQYELAKIEEARDVNTVQVLDKALPPEKKFSPKRTLIVLLSTFTSFFVAVFIAFALAFTTKIKTEDPERYGKIKEHFTFRRR